MVRSSLYTGITIESFIAKYVEYIPPVGWWYSFSVSGKIRWIWVILLAALIIRLPAIMFGLPYHVIADEEVNVYSALQMIQLHTLLPVLHQNAFTILYEPPLLSYLYVILFIPTLLVLYVIHGFPSLHHFAATLTLDPNVFWYVGRTAGVLISLGSIYVLYKIGRHLFKNEIVATLAALFLATSFLDTTLAATTRIWTPGIFASLLSLLLVLEAFSTAVPRRRLLVYAGIALGASFGFSYLVYYLPFMGCLLLYYSYTEDRAHIVRNIVYFAIPFIIVALCIIAVAPYPLYFQVFNHVIPSSSKSVTVFGYYYFRALWNYEPLLFIFGWIGVAGLAYRRRSLLGLFALFFITVSVPMYIFLPNMARYLMPLIPMVSLIAAYGLYSLARLAPAQNRNVALSVLVGLVALYSLVVFGRYEQLIFRNDTRVVAREWINANIPADDTVITDTDYLRLSGTPASIALQSQIASTSLRAADRTLLADGTLASHPFTLFTLYNVPPNEIPAILAAALTQPSPHYLVIDSWATSTLEVSALPKTLIWKIVGSGAVPGLDELFIGGNNNSSTLPILKLLYEVQHLGPDVSAYQLQ
jgi:hypothetical protein